MQRNYNRRNPKYGRNIKDIFMLSKNKSAMIKFRQKVMKDMKQRGMLRKRKKKNLAIKKLKQSRGANGYKFKTKHISIEKLGP